MSTSTDRKRTCWWLADKGVAADAVSKHAESLLTTYGRARRQLMAICRAVYLNESRNDYQDAGYYCPRPSKYPVTQGGVDSLASKLALSQPRPKITPGSRRFKAKRRAKMLQRWVDGLWRVNDTARLLDDQLHDALIYRAGVIKVVAKHNKVAHERRRPWDILTDPREETLSAIRSLFEIAAIDREVLAAQEYVEGSRMRDKILDISAPPEEDEATPKNGGGAFLDQVKVVEAWRLPPCPGEKGRHVMAVGNILLVDEPWEWDCFPFSILAWGRDPERMMGQSLVQRGMGVQSMINRHCETVDRAFARLVPKYAVSRNSGVDASVINDEVGQVVEYDIAGGPPTVLSPGPISPDFLNYTEMLASRWHAVTGVSQMDARSEADPTLESGKSKLVQADINSTRFYLQGKGRERACVKLAELSIRTADMLCECAHEEHEMEEGEEMSPMSDVGMSIISAYEQDEPEDDEREEEHPLDVPASRDSWREKIPYKVAKMDRKEYAVEVFPVSSLSQSIAGRMEEVAQLEAAGHITDKQQARELLDIPVLNDFQDLASARREAAEREIDRCLDGEQGIPTTYWGPDGLAYAIDRATNELALSGLEEAPDEVLDLLRTFIGAAEAQLTGLQPPAPEAPPVDPAMMGGPMPPDPALAGGMPMAPVAA